MGDRIKVFFAVVLFIAALILPLVGFGIGWYYWDVESGFYLMAGVFLVLLILVGLILLRVKDLSWLTVSLPYLLSTGYTVTDIVPLGVDDAIVTALGSLMTYVLALRKDPDTPRWIIVPLLGAAVYAFFGGFIPGGLDELIVNLVAIAMATAGTKSTNKEA